MGVDLRCGHSAGRSGVDCEAVMQKEGGPEEQPPDPGAEDTRSVGDSRGPSTGLGGGSRPHVPTLPFRAS